MSSLLLRMTEKEKQVLFYMDSAFKLKIMPYVVCKCILNLRQHSYCYQKKKERNYKHLVPRESSHTNSVPFKHLASTSTGCYQITFVIHETPQNI